MNKEAEQQIETIVENLTYTVRDNPLRQKAEADYSRHLLLQGYSLAEKEIERVKGLVETAYSSGYNTGYGDCSPQGNQQDSTI